MSKVRDLLIRYKTAKKLKDKNDMDIVLNEFLDMKFSEVVSFEDCETYRELEKEALKEKHKRKK